MPEPDGLAVCAPEVTGGADSEADAEGDVIADAGEAWVETASSGRRSRNELKYWFGDDYRLCMSVCLLEFVRCVITVVSLPTSMCYTIILLYNYEVKFRVQSISIFYILIL